jgi:hypothetical protein
MSGAILAVVLGWVRRLRRFHRVLSTHANPQTQRLLPNLSAWLHFGNVDDAVESSWPLGGLDSPVLSVHPARKRASQWVLGWKGAEVEEGGRLG